MGILDADFYFENIIDIDPEYLVENNIQAILIDLDNTVIDPQNNCIDNDVFLWLESLKKNNIATCFVSNRFSKKDEEKLTKALKSRVIVRAFKPLGNGLKYAIEYLNIDKKSICLVGDQTFTDVLGGNLLGIQTIKVDPINNCKEDGLLSTFCRRLEKKYFNDQEKNKVLVKNDKKLKNQLTSSS